MPANKIINTEIILFLDHSVNETLAIKIILDDNIIFNDLAKPEKRMPPIIFSETIPLSPGEHKMMFEDNTRNIVEEKKFNIPEIKTIFVKTEKDVVEGAHIVLDSEKVYVK